MAGLFDKQAAVYAKGRPKYPKEWFSMLASLTSDHKCAWDAGTGTGQAAVAVAEFYDHVIATDVSDRQIRHAEAHPKIRYVHTPLDYSDDDLVALLGGEGSVDLVTVATAVHWFDLPRFYAVVNRVLKNPGGIIAVWTYNSIDGPTGSTARRVFESSLPWIDRRATCVFEGYKTLPFPFDSVGVGSEGKPVELDIEVEMSLDDVVKFLQSSSGIVSAKDQGVDLLPDSVLNEMEDEWDDEPGTRRKLVFKAYMLAGKPKQ